MSNKKDNITKLNTVDRRLVTRIIVLCAAVLLVAALLVCILFYEQLNLDAARRWFKYLAVRNDETFGVSTFDAHSSNDYTLLGDGLAVTSVGGMQTFSDDGSDSGHYAVSLTEPVSCRGDKITLLYEMGGKTLMAVQEGSGEVLKQTADGIFYDADVSYGDTVATAASESGYKTVLRVYDKKQQEIFRWFSASRFMPWCAVSPTGEYLAAVALDEKDGSFDAVLHLFKTDKDEPVCTLSLGDALVYDLRFTQKETLCIVGENSLSFYDMAGDVQGVYDLSAAPMGAFDLMGEGFVLVQTNMYMAGSDVAVRSVDYSGKELGVLPVEGNLLDISANGSYAAVLTSEELIICRRDMSVYARVPNTWLATSALMRDDGTVIVAASSSAAIFIP